MAQYLFKIIAALLRSDISTQIIPFYVVLIQYEQVPHSFSETVSRFNIQEQSLQYPELWCCKSITLQPSGATYLHKEFNLYNFAPFDKPKLSFSLQTKQYEHTTEFFVSHLSSSVASRFEGGESVYKCNCKPCFYSGNLCFFVCNQVGKF